jgi:hypothetical protein
MSTGSSLGAAARDAGGNPMAGSTTRMQGLFAALAIAVAAIIVPSHAWAAGAAYQVDTVEISEAGACKVESWLSGASNKDFIGAVSPTCSVPFVRPLELSTQFNRSRAGDEWATSATPKVKVNLISSAIGTPGLAISGTASFDLITGENTSVAIVAPVTLRLSEVVRINVNGGWLWDRTVDRQYLTYGIGVDWRTPDNVWTLTAEVFGQTGATAEFASITQPRFQTGLRWRPIDRWNVDVIYGRNIQGENAHWVTLATIIRFPPPGK